MYSIHNPRSKCIESLKEEVKRVTLQNKKSKRKQQIITQMLDRTISENNILRTKI